MAAMDPAALPDEDFTDLERRRPAAVFKRRAKPRDGGSIANGKSKSTHTKSWIDRSLSSRRPSIIFQKDVVPRLPCSLQRFSFQKKKVTALKPPSNFIKEKQAHFAEVDAFELQEESPSPKTFARRSFLESSTCFLSARDGHHLEAVPEETFATPEELLSAALRTLPIRGVLRPNPDAQSLIQEFDRLSIAKPAPKSTIEMLLEESEQENVVSLAEAFSEFCDLKAIGKIGEGTFGEAYKGNGNVFKVVPMDGILKVNGETQKSSTEIYSEVLLSNTLNRLRDEDSPYHCTTFVETKATRICKGNYDKDLVRAWKKWDTQHNSENDQPIAFLEEQLYVVFVLGDGGTDLESFELLNYDEVKSLLLQVVLSLAIAEQAYGFEHRDLHWGNIVLSKDQNKQLDFRLDKRNLSMTTYGLSVALIDFTLSRIDTGEQVIFCDMSDPSWFEGPKGDVQADTYRRMRDITGGDWQGSFPKNNSVWIHYVAEIIRKKKTFKSTASDKRALSAFSKRCLNYDSAAAAIDDEIFHKMWQEI